MNENFLSHLNSLIKMADIILETVERKEIPRNPTRFIRYEGQNPPKTQYRFILNSELTTQWETSSTAFIEQNFGAEGSYLNNFKRYSPFSNVERVKSGRGVLKSIKTDCENGLFDENNIETINVDESFSTNTETIKNYCDKEAERNTRIYLIIIFEFLLLISLSFFYFFGIKYASIFTLIILIISYLISAFSLKEWTPTKLPERILELEKTRIYKRFGVDSD